MPEPYRNTYSFTSQAAPADTFHVVRVNGVEGLSRPYSFDILLLCAKADLDLEALAQSPATFTMVFEGRELPFHGVPALCEEQNSYQGFYFHRVVLVPRLWWLTLTRHNQIFLDQDLQTMLSQALTDGGLVQGRDFEFRLSGDYPAREYVCQYRETHFDFVSRWMERDGLYYFFEQTPDGEKMVVTDARTTHAPMSGAETLRYLPPSGLDWPVGTSAIRTFSRVVAQTPATVTLMDRNYLNPGATMSSKSQVSPNGSGERFLYGDHFLTQGEGDRLATVRAEELACRETVFEGLSSSPHLRSGYIFKLEGHFRDAVNDTYLTSEVSHTGGQEAYLSQLLGVSFQSAPDMPHYRNTFSAIPAKVQFRPQRRAETPRFHGVMNAVIDASQSGEYAEVDDQGRYKIVLPFDLSGRSGGKASSWLRMVQPYGGSDMGMHFPLHKGCEVLLTFQDGDPDRPVIQAALPNAEHESVTTSDNPTKCVLTTSGGNQLHMEDQEGSERILLQSPTENSWVRGGQPNDPPSAATNSPDSYGWKLNTNDTMMVRAGAYNIIIVGTTEKEYLGNNHKTVVGEGMSIDGMKKEFNFSKKIDVNLAKVIMRASRQKAVGMAVALNDECIDLAGQLSNMNASKTELEQLRDELEAKRAAVLLSRQELTQQRDELHGQLDTLTQQNNDINQEVLDLAEERTALGQSKVALVAERTTLRGQKSALRQQVTQLTLNNNVVGGQNVRLQATRTEVSEMNSALVGFRSIV